MRVYNVNFRITYLNYVEKKIVFTKWSLENVPRIAPNLPIIEQIPNPVVRTLVGNNSVENK